MEEAKEIWRNMKDLNGDVEKKYKITCDGKRVQMSNSLQVKSSNTKLKGYMPLTAGCVPGTSFKKYKIPVRLPLAHQGAQKREVYTFPTWPQSWWNYLDVCDWQQSHGNSVSDRGQMSANRGSASC